MGLKIMNKNIFIIHGWTYSTKPWTSTVSILRNRGFNITQLNVPGLTQKSQKVFTIEDYVKWLRQELKDEKDPIIIAHSNGGRIALNYLNKYPKSFSKLILIGSAGIFDDQPKTSLKNKTFKMLSKTFKPLAKIPIIRKIVYRILGVHDYNEAPESMKKTLKNMLDSDKELKVKYNGVETVLLWGEKDTETPLWMGKKMNKQISYSKIKVYNEWGHAPYITHPYELANELADIIKEAKK